ncbi:hypothetical protein T07_7614 [Trichinella nelsoni]|uniref:DUF7722 domain-containing protein n=1 Tax=Trichinella nelsoni TaxID=6336 RepID=A0A0V0RC63_9BILA|nr:hypothetical protein T07_7614 [Trichinella nelsoni]
MEEWRLDLLLKQYGLVSVSNGTLEEKRAYAIGAFLWPDQAWYPVPDLINLNEYQY